MNNACKKHRFAFEIRNLTIKNLEEGIKFAKSNDFDVIVLPCKAWMYREELGKVYDEETCKEIAKLGKEFHIHSEPESKRNMNKINGKYKEERDKSVKMFQEMVEFFSDPKLNVQPEFFETHSSILPQNQIPTVNNVNYLVSALSKIYHSKNSNSKMKLGLEYGRRNTCFTAGYIDTENNITYIEKVMNSECNHEGCKEKIKDHYQFIYDVALAYCDMVRIYPNLNQKEKMLETLKNYIQNYTISKIHWSNASIIPRGDKKSFTHASLKHGDLNDNDYKQIMSILVKNSTSDRHFVHLLEHTGGDNLFVEEKKILEKIIKDIENKQKLA